MTDPQKKAAGFGVTALAVLTLFFSAQSLPVMQWIMGELKLVFARDLFVSVMLAAITGAIAPAWLPHALPGRWPMHKTKRVTRLLGCGIAFVMVVFRYRSWVGVEYACFAATMSYVLWTAVSGTFYRWLPQFEPASLKPEPGPADSKPDVEVKPGEAIIVKAKEDGGS